MFFMPQNACDATVVSNSYGTILQGCPAPPIYGGSSSPTIETVVSNPATVKGVNMNWFLGENREPSLIVTLEALSTASAQEYTFTIMADYFTFPIYCGRISTRKPDLDEPQTQTISVKISCLRNTLTPSKRVAVAVDVKGPNNTHVTERFRLPSCQDSLMYYSNECTEERNRRISFKLEQHGNSVDVQLQTQTAYLLTKTVYVAIAQRNETSFIPWMPIGYERLLTFPQRTTTFSDLSIGATYQVTVWRPDEPDVRYANIITLKYDLKIKGSANFMKRLLGRKR